MGSGTSSLAQFRLINKWMIYETPKWLEMWKESQLVSLLFI